MADEIVFHCPDCKANLAAKREIAGKRVECPQCGRPIDVPTGSEGTPPEDS